MRFLNAPPPLLFLLSLAALAGLAYLAYRPHWRQAPRQGAILTALRGTFMILLLLFLYRPVLQRQQPVTVANRLVVLVDGSLSMGRLDSAGQPRNAALLADLQKFLAQLPPTMEPVLLQFAGTAERVPDVAALTATGMATNLGGAIEAAGAALAERPVAGIILISDGVQTRGRSPLQALAELNQRRLAADLPGRRGGRVPVFTVQPAAGEAGTRIVALSAPLATIADRPVPITANVQGAGPLTVELYEELAAGSELHLATLANLAPGEVTINQLLAGVGSHRLRLTVSGPGIDPEAGDNSWHCTVKVLTPPEVLLLTGSLSWEYRYLRAALESLKGIRTNVCAYDDTRAVYGFGEHALTLAKSAQWTPAAAGRFSALILLDAGPELLTENAATALREAVGSGRVGLAVAGQKSFVDNPRLTGWLPAAPLPAVPAPPGRFTPATGRLPLPVKLASYEAGERSVAFTPTAAAQVLARYGPDGPAAIVAGRSGIGRVVQVGPALWPAVFGASTDSTPVLAFWQDVVRYLTPNSWLRVTPSFAPGAAIPGEEVAVTVETEEENAAVNYRVAGPGLAASGVLAAKQKIRFLPAVTGDYQVEVNNGGPDDWVGLTIPVSATREENGVADRDPGLLAALARESGGRQVASGRLAELIPELAGRSTLSRIETVDLWDYPAWLFLLTFLLAGEWLLRRRWGLL